MAKRKKRGDDPAFKGTRADVKLRLLDYIDCLKKGMGRRAAASSAHVSYDTVMRQRDRNEDFAEMEAGAEQHALSEVEDALFTTAKTGNVGAIALFLKYRHGWSDVSRVELVEKLRSQERSDLFRALDAAGLTESQLAAFEQAYEGDASTVH